MRLIQDFVKAVKRTRRRILLSRDPVAYARSLGVRVGKNCRLLSVNFGSEPYLVTLGDHVSATLTYFITHDGGIWVFRDRDPNIDTFSPIHVGSNVFIGLGTIILPGVTIGDNVVIGAGAVVTRDIPSNCVAAGVPARRIKSIEEYWSSFSGRTVPTKLLSRQEKRAYLTKHFGLPGQQ